MHSTTLIASVIVLVASSVNARALPGQSLAPRHAFGTSGQCAPQPLGSGPVTNSPDTADAFLANPAYSTGANSAQTPTGWSLAYQNLRAASTTGGYLGVEELTSYNTSYCASQCCGFWPGCTSFNIYYERNPTVDPGDNCTDPSSTTRIKCSFWSQSLSPSDATNNGQYCANFHVVIAGSNGYNGGCAASSTTTTASATTTTSSSTASSSTTSTSTTSSSAISTTTKASTTTTAPASTWAPWMLTTCPSPEITYTAADGSTWAICKGTDYQGQTNQNVYNINDNKSCAAACDTTNGCTKAVYYAQNKVCYIKGGSLNWVTNPIYDSIRQLTPPTPKATPTSATNNWNTWTQPKKTCFLWICW